MTSLQCNAEETAHRRFPIVFASILILMALGIVLFWVHWFVSGSYRTGGSECYRAFENSFPLPDGVLAGMLVTTAMAALRRSPRTLLPGYVAAGMLICLAAMDFHYGMHHGAFQDFSSLETWMKAGICMACGGVAGFLANGLGRLPLPNPYSSQWVRPGSVVGRLCRIAAACLMCSYVGLYCFELNAGQWPHGGEGVLRSYNHFLLALRFGKTISFALAVGALVCLWNRHRLTLAFALLHSGCSVFCGLVRVKNSVIRSFETPDVTVVIAVWLFYAVLLAFFTWHARSTLRQRRPAKPQTCDGEGG